MDPRIFTAAGLMLAVVFAAPAVVAAQAPAHAGTGDVRQGRGADRAAELSGLSSARLDRSHVAAEI